MNDSDWFLDQVKYKSDGMKELSLSLFSLLPETLDMQRAKELQELQSQVGTSSSSPSSSSFPPSQLTAATLNIQTGYFSVLFQSEATGEKAKVSPDGSEEKLLS